MKADRAPSAPILGLLYGSGLVILLSVALFSERARGPLLLSTVMIFLACGFLLARYFHQDSTVFRTFVRFGRLQTHSFSPEDKCLSNFFLFMLAGIVVLLAALF